MLKFCTVVPQLIVETKTCQLSVKVAILKIFSNFFSNVAYFTGLWEREKHFL